MPISWGRHLLCRVFQHVTEDKDLLIENAIQALSHYSASQQKPDGSWDYGDHWNVQRWIDNFHTGYNLGALRDIHTYTGIEDFEPHVKNGFKFYIDHFFRSDGAPRYFHNHAYPLDIHCVAQSIDHLADVQGPRRTQ